MENNNNAMEIILVGAILVCATIAIGGQYILKKAISDSICKSFEKQILETDFRKTQTYQSRKRGGLTWPLLFSSRREHIPL